MGPGTCAIPLGLQHPDHQEVRQIALSCVGSGGSAVDWVVYEDLPYGRNDPDGSSRAEAVAAIESAGLRLSELRPDLDPDMTTKAAAVACYPSQLLALRLSPTFDADHRDRALLVPVGRIGARSLPLGPLHHHPLAVHGDALGQTRRRYCSARRWSAKVPSARTTRCHGTRVTGSGQDLTDGPGGPGAGTAADAAVRHHPPRGDGGHTGQHPAAERGAVAGWSSVSCSPRPSRRQPRGRLHPGWRTHADTLKEGPVGRDPTRGPTGFGPAPSGAMTTVSG